MSADDSAVRLLGALLPWDGYLLALVEAYFDESGSHEGSPVLCVAGYLFERDAAKNLSEEWHTVLEPKGLTHFHMIDCAHGVEEFAELSLDERIDIQTQLIKIIKKYHTRRIVSLMVPDDYQDLMPFHGNMGSDYNYCLWNCLEGVRLWVDEAQFDGDIAYFFESGHASQSEANRIMEFAFANEGSRRPFRYMSHAFVDKKKFPPVQAADILAWQMFTDWKHGAIKRSRRKDFAALIEDKKHRHTVMNRERIMYHVSRMIAQGAWLDD